MTHKEIIIKIRETKDAIDLIKSLPSTHIDLSDKIIITLNKQLENRLKEYHKALMEVVVEK